eukprot:maker-scaffold846_size89341-snap-gene-0.13 protein:Tk05674 transcript:maker-scaffold846_size89341-snap-gene-0.13-mRNA-1 annotation:"hypothetical protein DAPPUDRAFT_302769"
MGRKQGSVHVQVENDGHRRTYMQHDERSQTQGSHNRVWRRNDKRVSFQERGGGGGVHKRLGPKKPNVFRNFLGEGDEEMSGGHEAGGRGGYSGRGRPQRGGRARIPGHGPGIRKGRGRGPGGYINPSTFIRAAGGTLPQPKGWHRVTLRKGSLYPKNELLALLVQKCPVPFAPISYTKQGINNVFYVETKDMSENLKSLDQAIIMPDGYKLSIMTSACPPPNASKPDEEMLDKLKNVMSSRYVAENKALNLRKFYSDPQFLGEPFYAPLNRSQIMNFIIKVIGEHVPEVEAIDLSENGLRSLEDLEKLTEKAPNVKILYLSKNNLNNPKDFIKIKNWKLVELKLDSNPLIDKFNDFIGAVRTVFPTLITLDGAPLPKLITFDDEDEATQLPPTIVKQTVAAEAETLVLQFLEQYLRVFDSDNREPLVEAYHADAVMSMNTSYPMNTTAQGSSKLSEFILESRNLFEVPNLNKRMKQLHTGKLAIVAFLNTLPKTETDMNSVTLDIPFATERLMTFTVTGMFRQRATKNNPIRHFNRVFLVVPQGSGFVIVNEMLYITNPTPMQLQTAFKATPPPSSMPGPVVDANAMQLRCAQLSEKTGMNLPFCKQCLEQTNWDLEQGYISYMKARSEGKVPPEAFVK